MSILEGVTYEMLSDEQLKEQVINELHKMGYDLVYPPDVPVPFKDEFLNGGVTWMPVTNTTYDSVKFTKNCRAYLVRRQNEGAKLMSFFFHKKKDVIEIQSGYTIEFLAQCSLKRLDKNQTVVIPKGTLSNDYRTEAITQPIPEGHIRILIHGEDIGSSIKDYFEVDAPLSVIAFFSYEFDPRTNKPAFKVYKSGYKEKL